MTVHSYAQEHMYIICRRVPLQFLPFAKPIISLITLNTNNEFSLLALFSCAAAHARETDSETDRQTDRQREALLKKVFSFSRFLYIGHNCRMTEKNT